MVKMDLYEQLQTPPNDALKPIMYGALKGKSDINPQWRYEALTAALGPCGCGWRFEIADTKTQSVSTGETMVFVLVNLYIKHGEEWSAPIPGWGGDYLVKKDKNGIHGNDEAFKMATTDALGTAMKMIGVAADVYRGLIANGTSDSKYARRDYMAQTAQNRPQAAAKQNAGTYKGTTTKTAVNGAQDEMKTKAIKSLNAEIERTGVACSEVKAIALAKYGKDSVNKMTTTEICDLANNLEKFLMEQINEASAKERNRQA